MRAALRRRPAGAIKRREREGVRAMAKGQKKSNKEARKPKKEVKKTIAANPSTKGGSGLAAKD
jgi:hypothetical protein